MTTGTCPERSAWGVRWAAECLGVEPGAGPEAARAVLLRHLPGVDFVPPAAWQRAFLVLVRPEESPVEIEEFDDYLRERADELREEIESFAERYWELPPADRRVRWQELIGRCACFPQLLARLQMLERGLDIGPSDTSREPRQVGELIATLQRLSVLRPGPRAQERQAFRSHYSLAADVHGWETAAQIVASRYPVVAALEPSVVNELANWKEQQRYVAKMRRKLKAAERRSRESEGSSRQPFAWVIVVLVILGARLISYVFKNPDSNDSSRRPSIDSKYQPSRDEKLQRQLREMFRDKGPPGEATRRLLGEKPGKEKESPKSKDSPKANPAPAEDRP